MNQEQLNDIVDLFNDVRREAGSCVGDDVMEYTLKSVFAVMSCYLYAYKHAHAESYDLAKNVLQNITDMFTLGLDIETTSPKEGEFSMETQHLVFMGDYK